MREEARMLLTFTKVLDALTIDRLPVLVRVGHEEALEVLLDRPANHVNGDPLGNAGGFDIAQVL